MRLQRLRLRNFRSYYGEQSIDLSPIDDNHLVIIFGENMSGKTGIFLALYWCLYGEAYGRRGESIPIYSRSANSNNYLINAKAIEDGDYVMEVELVWTHDGDSWQLTRQETCHGDPTVGDSFESWVNLTIGGNVKARQEIEQRVNQLLHHHAAQFYLFDGELLSQYEQWLEDPDQRETTVQRAIEMTVGAAALRSHEDMATVADEAEAQQARIAKRENRAKNIVSALEAKRDHARDLQQEIDEYGSEIIRLDAQQQQVEDKHGRLAEFSAEQGRLKHIEDSIDRTKQRETDAVSEIHSLVHTKHFAAAASASKNLRQSLIDSLHHEIEVQEHRFNNRQLRQSLAVGICQLCRHRLEPASKQQMNESLQSGKADHENIVDIDSMRQIVTRLNSLDGFLDDGILSTLCSLEQERLNARNERYKLSEEAQSIRSEFSDRPRGDRDAEMERLKGIIDDIGNTRSSLNAAKTDLGIVRGEIRELNDKLARIQIDPSVQRKALAARLAVDAMKEALDEFGQLAKLRVEAHASEVFVRLVEDADYAGLRIDDDYRIFPIDPDGMVLPIPSAGGQQLVTLSLIAGLNAAAVHDAPIVMDTPAGRIDKRNRQRILRWIERLDQQTILMVHSGEFEAREVEAMGVQPARTYVIEKTGAKTSQIRRINT